MRQAWGAFCTICGVGLILVGMLFAIERGEVAHGVFDVVLGLAMFGYGMSEATRA